VVVRGPFSQGCSNAVEGEGFLDVRGSGHTRSIDMMSGLQPSNARAVELTHGDAMAGIKTGLQPSTFQPKELYALATLDSQPSNAQHVVIR